MAKASTVKSAFINHLGIVRGMFQGEGDLVVTAFSLEQKDFEECPIIELVEDADEYSDSLGNFKKQLMQIEFAVEEVDEWFTVSDVIAFIKPVESGFPL